MAEGNASEGFSKSRSALGDLTNRLGKRGLSERQNSAIKSFNFCDKSKRICVSPRPCTEIKSLKENVVSSISTLNVPNENRDHNLSNLASAFVVTKSLIDVEADSDNGCSLKRKSCLMGNSKNCGENTDIEILDPVMGISVSGRVNEFSVDKGLVDGAEIGCSEADAFERDKLASQNSEGHNLTFLEERRALNSNTTEADDNKLCLMKEKEIFGSENNCTRENDELGDSFLTDTSRTVSETGNDDEHKAAIEATQSDMNGCQNYGDDHLVMSQCGSVDCMVLPESQESTVFGVEGSTELKKGDGCAYMSGGIDSIKSCSCSFCTKAAYMLLDLNYQDIKARVSALRKSQKEANILAERSIKSKDIETLVTESSSRVSKLESDLMHQWRFLFQHMANIWDKEGNQLEAKLVPLTDLREKCKTDMQFTNGKH